MTNFSASFLDLPDSILILYSLKWKDVQQDSFMSVSSSSAGDYDVQASQTQHRESAQCTRMEKYHTSLQHVEALENDMAALGIDVPWTKEHPKFQEALEYS